MKNRRTYTAPELTTYGRVEDLTGFWGGWWWWKKKKKKHKDCPSAKDWLGDHLDGYQKYGCDDGFS